MKLLNFLIKFTFNGLEPDLCLTIFRRYHDKCFLDRDVGILIDFHRSYVSSHVDFYGQRCYVHEKQVSDGGVLVVVGWRLHMQLPRQG